MGPCPGSVSSPVLRPVRLSLASHSTSMPPTSTASGRSSLGRGSGFNSRRFSCGLSYGSSTYTEAGCKPCRGFLRLEKSSSAAHRNKRERSPLAERDSMYRAFVLMFAVVIASMAPGQQPKPIRPAITGISHMTLYADDLEKSQQFYGSLVGWKQVPSGQAQSGVRFYANHKQFIELVSPASKGLADRLVSIGFSTSDADAMRKFLAANGVPVPQEVTVDQEGDK